MIPFFLEMTFDTHDRHSNFFFDDDDDDDDDTLELSCYNLAVSLNRYNQLS
jgi:hypothetical protein